MLGRQLGPLSQIVLSAEPLSDFPDLKSADGSNMRTITFHGDIPEPADRARDGNGINAIARWILV